MWRVLGCWLCAVASHRVGQTAGQSVVKARAPHFIDHKKINRTGQYLQFCYLINTYMPIYKLHVIEFDSLNTLAGKSNIITKGLGFPTTNNMQCNETEMQLKTFPPKSMTNRTLLAHKISTSICVVMTAGLFITV